MIAVVHFLIFVAIVVAVALIIWFVLKALLPLIPAFPPQILIVVGVVIMLVAVLVIAERGLPLIGGY